MKFNNKKSPRYELLNYFTLLFILVFCSFFQINSVEAQNAVQANETDTEELDWNVGGTKNNELTKEEKELAQQTALGWEQWDKEHPSETSVIIYDAEKSVETNKVKSPNEILRSTLIGNWEGFYGGSKAYINFKENKTVIINTSVFSNIPSASGREHTQLYYEVDASQSPYKLTFYNRNKEIKGVFRINDNNQITMCHNFNTDEEPKEINNKYTLINFYKLESKISK
ncbi:hypothetical protein WAF17_17405 [Bernardetia sp. ABR2-2B]|uniref:hypothetical protein n=1 Tax=Bernardetia sp. ABR2-2B TaxID=3127472 RepID=UPI0030D2E403